MRRVQAFWPFAWRPSGTRARREWNGWPRSRTRAANPLGLTLNGERGRHVQPRRGGARRVQQVTARSAASSSSSTVARTRRQPAGRVGPRGAGACICTRVTEVCGDVSWRSSTSVGPRARSPVETTLSARVLPCRQLLSFALALETRFPLSSSSPAVSGARVRSESMRLLVSRGSDVEISIRAPVTRPGRARVPISGADAVRWRTRSR